MLYISKAHECIWN